MSTSLRRHLRTLTAALAIASAGAGPAHAFPPSTALSLLDSLGQSHQTQTETAVRQVLNQVYGITELTIFHRDALRTITDANIRVDHAEANFSSAHFDAENFLGGHERIMLHRNDVLRHLREGNGLLARGSLGLLLHTLQDFYTHSNWIERGNRAPLGMLTRPGTTRAELAQHLATWRAQMSPATEATCQDCVVSLILCHDCSASVTTSRLTSGYYGGQDRNKPETPRKCSHGGSLDSTADDPGFLSVTFGMNKDTLNCTLSPRNDLHGTAAAISLQATIDFLLALREEVTDFEFRLLFGVGASVAVVMDTTTSMEDILQDVSQSAAEVVQARSNTNDAPIQYTLVPFKDPGIGPITSSSDFETFQSSLTALEVGGGSDCAEPSMRATLRAVASVNQGSSVFLYTDASSKDEELSDAVSSLAASKDVTVYPSVFGSCSPYDPAFFKIARETGGQVFILARADAGKVGNVMDVVTRSESTRVATIELPLSPDAERTWPVAVDGSMRVVNISVSGTGNLELLDPTGAAVSAGADVEVTEMSGGRLYRITQPAAGEWQLRLADRTPLPDEPADAMLEDRASVVITTESSIALTEFRFVVDRNAGGPHAGWHPIYGSPVAGERVRALVRVSGGVGAAELRLVTIAGEELSRTPLERIGEDEFFHAWVNPPAQPFYVQVEVVAPSGETTLRGSPRLFRGQQLALEVVERVEARPGEEVAHSVSVENRGDAGRFLVSAFDDAGFELRHPEAVELVAGEPLALPLSTSVPRNAQAGTVQTITVVLRSEAQPELYTYAVLATHVVNAPGQDDDLYPDELDNCPEVYNPDQEDRDQDGVGDLCDDDRDQDGVRDERDNCVDVANADQKDRNEDGVGDACAPGCSCRVVGAPAGPGTAFGLGLSALLSAGLLWRRRSRKQGLGR